MGFVEVPGSAAGVIGDGDEAGSCGEVAVGNAASSPTPTSKDAPRIGPKPGIEVMIAACGCWANVAAIWVSRALTPGVEGQDVGGQFADNGGGQVLSWKDDPLGAGGGDGAGGNIGVVADPAVLQPRR